MPTSTQGPQIASRRTSRCVREAVTNGGGRPSPRHRRRAPRHRPAEQRSQDWSHRHPCRSSCRRCRREPGSPAQSWAPGTAPPSAGLSAADAGPAWVACSAVWPTWSVRQTTAPLLSQEPPTRALDRTRTEHPMRWQWRSNDESARKSPDATRAPDVLAHVTYMQLPDVLLHARTILRCSAPGRGRHRWPRRDAPWWWRRNAVQRCRHRTRTRRHRCSRVRCLRRCAVTRDGPTRRDRAWMSRFRGGGIGWGHGRRRARCWPRRGRRGLMAGVLQVRVTAAVSTQLLRCNSNDDDGRSGQRGCSEARQRCLGGCRASTQLWTGQLGVHRLGATRQHGA